MPRRWRCWASSMPTASASAATTRRRPNGTGSPPTRGDRDAMFALAMFHLGGRARRRQPRGGGQAARRRRQARAHPPPPTISACSISKASMFPQDFARAAELFRSAAQAGNPEAQYALAPSTRKAAASPRTSTKPRGCWPRRPPPTMSTPRSNTPSRCSTAPASPRTRPRRPRCCAEPRCKGNPIAQNRLASILAIGRGAAGRSGRGDQVAHRRQGRRRRATCRSTTSCRSRRRTSAPPAEKAAQPWLDAIKASRS